MVTYVKYLNVIVSKSLIFTPVSQDAGASANSLVTEGKELRDGS